MPNFFNPYQQIYPQNNFYQQPTPIVSSNEIGQQIQNGGFVPVRGETEARNYPVRLGTSVTFKDETAPYVYTKTMGFSQLDQPKFDKYRLVKEEEREEVPVKAQNNDLDVESILGTIDDLKNEIKIIWDEIEGIKSAIPKKTGTTKRKEDGGD